MKVTTTLLALIVGVTGIAIPAKAQMPVPPPTAYGQLLTDAQLDQMLGPIALYPDPLMAQILPAATQPSQVVLAFNYISQGGDPNQIDQQPWDESVKAVAHYPDVLGMLESNLPWTTALGQAFINQPTDMMNSIQRLRAQAQQYGNLQSTPQQEVIDDDGAIEIVPANPDMVYVPTYDPGVIFYQPCYGQPFITFGIGFPIGVWFNHDFNWRGHNIIVWGHDHPRPTGWWHQRPSQRPHSVVGHAPVWRPTARPAVAPVRGGDRGYETRPAYTAPIRAPQTRPEITAPVRTAPPQTRPEIREPAPRQSVPRSYGGAFAGVQSTVQTREASSRGMASRQTMPEPSSGGRGKR